MASPPRFQFSIAGMLILTAIVAAIVAILTALDIPWRMLASLMGTYAVFFALWALVRGPTLYRNYRDLRRRRQLAADAYKVLAEEIRRKRAVNPSASKESPAGLSPLDD